MSSDLAAAFAERLRLAHRQVAALDLPDEQKAVAARRLIALTDASKRDIGRASARLDLLLADLEAGRVAAADDPSGADEGP